METCEVLVVGGGPAGSTCAGRLRHAGLDVLLMDKDLFPRHKPCAGWITPAVFYLLALDTDEYRQGNLLQDISSFRTGLINGPDIVTKYGATVSYGIRRSEFDNYLLKRSGVRQSLGESVTSLERKNGDWIVNGRIRARLLVGAGGHFCPVARRLGAKIGREEVVAAQVTEAAMSAEEGRLCRIRPETPALFFSRDMKGYGWLIRKGNYLNIGFGRMDTGTLTRHSRDFFSCLRQRNDLPSRLIGRFQGHTYRLYGGEGRRDCVGDGALLIGDSAGLAHPFSGEGILPAIESALLAAETVLAAKGDYRRDNLEPYPERLDLHLGGAGIKMTTPPLLSRLSRFIGARLITNRWLVRHIVLDRWFLHANRMTLKQTPVVQGIPGITPLV